VISFEECPPFFASMALPSGDSPVEEATRIGFYRAEIEAALTDCSNA
jgi:hypothetical protein